METRGKGVLEWTTLLVKRQFQIQQGKTARPNSLAFPYYPHLLTKIFDTQDV